MTEDEEKLLNDALAFACIQWNLHTDQHIHFGAMAIVEANPLDFKFKDSKVLLESLYFDRWKLRVEHSINKKILLYNPHYNHRDVMLLDSNFRIGLRHIQEHIENREKL